MNDKRLNIFPTRMNLNITKENLKSSLKGHSLLKRKSDAISFHHRKLKKNFTDVNIDLKAEVFDAHIALSQAEYYCPDIRAFVNECSQRPIEIVTENTQIAGVNLVSFKIKQLTNNEIQSLSSGGIALMKARNKFVNLLERIVEISSIKNSFLKLDEVFKATNRRVNALETILIPKMENTIKYIQSELDEGEREDFYRMKKIQSNKEKKEKAEEEEKQKIFEENK